MSNSRAFVITGMVCFVVSGVVFAGPYWRPDLVIDNYVDFFDFAVLAENWGQTGIALYGDLNEDGIINIEDLERFTNWWPEEYEEKRADFNFDYIVNFEDFAELANKWLSESGDAGWDSRYDLDESEAIDIYDLQLIANRWLKYEARIIYVDADANPGGDGSSWHNAFNYLQDALVVAGSTGAPPAGASCEIYVAEGVYKPDASSEYPDGTGLRTAMFQLPEGVAIYGGFPSGGGPLKRRDYGKNETTLSGDIGIEGQTPDNCYNVVVGANDVSLDGLTIADGYADSTGDHARGAGMRNEDVNNLTIANCTFRDNYARYDGGGIYNYESEVAITNCVFSNNTSGDDGGGIYSSNADGTFTDCTFSDNQSANRGGGMYNYQSGFEVINCLFGGNHADANGGAVFNGYKAVKMINCTIAGNSAAVSGGGVYNTYSASTIINCIVWDNGNAIYNKSAEPHISYCDIQGSGGSGAGWNAGFGLDEGNNIDIVPNFDEGLTLTAGSPCIDAGNNFVLPRWVITDIKGNARFNGSVDMGVYEFGWLDMSQDSDRDGMPDWWEYRYELNPNDANDANDDLDEDGLNNGDEYENNCDVMFFDSDGDLLSDGWEILYGLNPLQSDVVEVVDGNNVYADTDSDGLDALREIIFATNPTMSDSDGDGASDGIEVSQGSLPMDATDSGLPPSADQICELKLTVGDWSDSQSERYDLIVGPVTHQATQFGVVKTSNYRQFRPGNRYEVRIVHRGTNPNRSWYPNADYDYVAQIESVSLPAGVVMQIDDPDGILGTHGEPNTPTLVFDAAGKTAYVDLIKIEVVDIKFNHSTGDTGDGIAIYDVAVPEWVKGGQNKPASYKNTTEVTVKAKFTVSPSSITSAKIRANTSDEILGYLSEQTVNFSNGVSSPEYITFVPHYPTPIPVSSGTVIWQWSARDIKGQSTPEYNINLSGPHTTYIVFDSPKCSLSEYTTEHLRKATEYGDGGAVYVNNVCSKVQIYLHANQNFTANTGPDGENGIWNIIDPDGPDNQGDCIAHANLMKVSLKVLGIDASYAFVADANNQPSEDGPIYKRYWCSKNSREERKHFREESGGTLWNFEGVCGVGGIYYDVAFSETSGTYEYCKTPGNGIVYQWFYVYESSGSWGYECGDQNDVHIPIN